MKTWFSLADAAQFQPVSPGFARPPASPDFAFGEMPEAVKSAFNSPSHMWSVGVYTGHHMGLCDGFVFDQAHSLLAAGDLAIHPSQIENIGAELKENLQNTARRVLPGRVASIIPPGPAYHIYGHWLVDILPRLTVLQSAGLAIGDLWYPLPGNTPAFGHKLLEFYGVPAERIIHYQKAEILVAEELVMPTLVHNGFVCSPVLASFVDAFKQGLLRAGHVHAGAAAHARIFLARVGGNRRLLNREKIETLAQDAGFHVVRPETMSLPAQFALFASAREITGEYGSAFHTSLLSPNSTVVCGLRGSQLHPGFMQSGIGHLCGQPTGWVFGQSGGGPGPHDFTVLESDFADALRQVFGWNGKRRAETGTPFPPGDDAAPAKLRWTAVEQTYVKAGTTLAAHLPESQKFAVRVGDVIECDTADAHDNHLALTAARLNGEALPERLWYIYPLSWLRS